MRLKCCLCRCSLWKEKLVESIVGLSVILRNYGLFCDLENIWVFFKIKSIIKYIWWCCPALRDTIGLFVWLNSLSFLWFSFSCNLIYLTLTFEVKTLEIARPTSLKTQEVSLHYTAYSCDGSLELIGITVLSSSWSESILSFVPFL